MFFGYRLVYRPSQKASITISGWEIIWVWNVVSEELSLAM